MADVTVASLNIRGVPLTGSRLTARCQAIGVFFEASDVDVVCFQEVHTYGHLALLARRMRSFRYVSFRRAVPGPAGDVVTFSRLPVSSTVFHGFGPVAARIPRLARLSARMKGALVTSLARPGVSVINTHPLANTDGDWSEANRFFPAHRAQLAALSRVIGSAPVPAVVCGDFNVDRNSGLFAGFLSENRARLSCLVQAAHARLPTITNGIRSVFSHCWRWASAAVKADGAAPSPGGWWRGRGTSPRSSVRSLRVSFMT